MQKSHYDDRGSQSSIGPRPAGYGLFRNSILSGARVVALTGGWVRKNRLLLGVFLVFSAAYFYNLDAWLMHDDEGTDFYEVWQLQQGQRPGVDFAAEQQPLYLILGKAIISAAGRSPFALRLLSTAQVLLGALVLAFTVGYLWNEKVAASTLGLILVSGLVCEQARLFRPDPMMFAWELLGLAAALLAIRLRRRWLWALAGGALGVAFLFKPFGLFPMVGLGIYFVIRLGRGENWREVVADGVSVGGAFLLIGGGVAWALYAQLGFYYAEPLAQHLGLRDTSTIGEQVAKALRGYALLWLANGVFAFIGPLWLLNRPRANQQIPGLSFLLAQLASPAVFIGVTRPIHVRYYIYLVPYLAILLGWHLDLAMAKIGRQSVRSRELYPLAICLILGFAGVTTLPGLWSVLARKDEGTLALARYVAENTEPGDLVLSDYAGINFFADRASIYEASIIAGGRIEGQVITGQLLIERMEHAPVEMVLMHTEGGFPPPHQLVKLVDYDEFRDYLGTHFVLLTTFDRSGQRIEVYKKR